MEKITKLNLMSKNGSATRIIGFAGRILVEPDALYEGKLALPDSALEQLREANSHTGIVRYVGDGERMADGTILPMRVAVGDWICYGQAHPVKISGKVLDVVNESAVICKLE